ncbi:MAG: right-handed parallel beta-helix repeat-containing protein [Planctomycetaceae bacterium]|nr:right-handed parallel beta-helix repeat-containing protein [Planctomycetaceae bacterium]
MSNVRDFGAMGDGQADDWEAIQHAIDNGDGLVELPRGEYRISQPLLVDLDRVSRTAIVGAGGTAKLIMAGPGPAIFLKATHAKTADPLGFRPEEWQHERMPTIDGIEIQGDHPEADGVQIQGVMQPTLTRVLIRQVRTAVHITDRARNVLIDACHFYHNTGVGVHLDGLNLHQCIISSSHISYCRRGGIRIENSEIRNLQITGNDIEYNNNRAFAADFPDAEDEPTGEIFIDVGTGSVREGTICSNTIQATYSSQGANIRMIGAGPDANHRVGMFCITGNLLGNQRYNIHLNSVWGISLSGNYLYSGHSRNLQIENSRNIVIGPNTFGHNPDYNDKELATGVRILKSEGVAISGLQIQDAQAGKHTLPEVPQIQRDALVELVECRNVSLSGCQILDGTPLGLLVDTCHGTTITGCQIVDQRKEQKMAIGVEFRGQCDHTLLANCLIQGAATQPVLKSEESKDAVLESNVLT